MSGGASSIAADLEAVLDAAADDLKRLRGARIFITGGTGFVGSWLLESFTWANRRLALGATAVVLTRNAATFAARLPHVASDSSIVFERGDVLGARDFPGTFDFAVHGATSSSLGNDVSPAETVATIVDGTRSVLELLARSGPIPVLFLSSGAVYGRQPPAMERLTETYLGGPDPLEPASTYHESKRLAEHLCAVAARAAGPQVSIARLFALVGPYLPIDRHFAAGNFIRDALAGGPILVNGDGTPVRAYLYGADLAIWLWAILMRGAAGRAYNVGGDRTCDIASLAHLVAEAADGIDVSVTREATPGMPAERYVPDIERARTELALRPTVSLESAIARTLHWHRGRIRPT